MRNAANRENQPPTHPNVPKTSPEMQRMKDFLHHCKSKKQQKRPLSEVVNPPTPPNPKQIRRSNRNIVTPDKTGIIVSDDGSDVSFSGEPPRAGAMWTKQSLICTLIKLEGTGKANAFMNEVVNVGKTQYKNRSSILGCTSSGRRGRSFLLEGADLGC
mmetsp:Transcript_28984/g.61266  ORF Transcript_28984/g.61266 Transcript_28984/m.61266 type:complete len:158 (+) Transcript_28984:691-1164(+)